MFRCRPLVPEWLLVMLLSNLALPPLRRCPLVRLKLLNIPLRPAVSERPPQLLSSPLPLQGPQVGGPRGTEEEITGSSSPPQTPSQLPPTPPY